MTDQPVDDQPVGEHGRIVVGVDGSPASQEALRWALDEGRRREAVVEAVMAWTYPPLTYAPLLVGPPTFAHDDFEESARAELDAAIEAVLAGKGEPERFERAVVEGSATHVLLELARRADLLVVGYRGKGGFRDLLLGSVAHQCAAHSECPVVIVRGPARR